MKICDVCKKVSKKQMFKVSEVKKYKIEEICEKCKNKLNIALTKIRNVLYDKMAEQQEEYIKNFIKNKGG